MNLQENIQRIKEVMGLLTEGLHDTSWENEEGNKITLVDLLSVLIVKRSSHKQYIRERSHYRYVHIVVLTMTQKIRLMNQNI